MTTLPFVVVACGDDEMDSCPIACEDVTAITAATLTSKRMMRR